MEDLELVLGDLKDVVKEFKEVRGVWVGKEFVVFCFFGVLGFVLIGDC